MADRFYGYQYDTNPRKLNQQYAPYRKRYPKNEEPVNATNKKQQSRNTNLNNKGANNNGNISEVNRIRRKTQESKVSENRKTQVANNKSHFDEDNEKLTKQNVKSKLKIIVFLIMGFSVLFAVSYQNSLISESFNKKEQSKKEWEALKKTNQQIEVSIENNLNLNNIEQVAKEKLGMQKLNNSQKIYVSLPKVDYVAPATEKIVVEEDLNFFQKLMKGFGK